MKTIQSKVLKDFVYPEPLKSFIPKDDFVLFDIETTGLSHSKSEVILIGYIIYDGSDYVLCQLFCENRREEKELLLEFKKVLEQKKYYITFNGRAFDLPYTNSRFKHFGIEYVMPKCNNLDIMRLVKLNKDHFNFSDFKLKTVEKFLDIDREDTISGKESVELYELYEETQSKELEHKILLHNYEDILYLMRCLEIVDHVDPLTMYLENPLTIHGRNFEAYIQEMKVKGDKVIATLHAPNFSSHDYYDFNSVVTWSYDSKLHTLEMTCPLFTLNVDSHSYQFADIDLMELEPMVFNNLSYEMKMEYLISQSGQLKHRNIYRLVQKCFEHLI